jgi:hypothetical protein
LGEQVGVVVPLDTLLDSTVLAEVVVARATTILAFIQEVAVAVV